MIRWLHRRWLAVILLIGGAAMLQGCVYGPYGGYPGYAPYAYPGYGYPAGGAVVVAPGGYYHGGYGGGEFHGGYH